MSRQLELIQEERTKRRHDAIIRALEFGLVGAIAAAGTELTGFSVRLGDWECLITLRGVRDGIPSVSFVGSEDMGSCILKCVREAQKDNLTWKEDQYAK